MGVLEIARTFWNHPLARRRGLPAACARMVRWQLAQRLMPGPMALPFVDGSVLVCERGMAGATGNWYFGLMEPPEMGLTLHLLRDNSLFVDIGSNIGAFTILASAAVGARSVAVEPVPATFARLQRNIAINRVTDRVEIRQLGVSDRPGRLRFSVGLDAMNHVMREDEPGPFVEVAVTTLDALIGDRAPTLIKIDVEGHEEAVLRGASQTLARPDVLAVIMEVCGAGRTDSNVAGRLIAAMAGHGFQPFEYDPFERKLTPFSGSLNCIFARDAAAVTARCREAPRFNLINGPI